MRYLTLAHIEAPWAVPAIPLALWVGSLPKLGPPQQNSFVGQADVSRTFLSP